MDSILILVAVLAVGVGVLYFLMRSGRVKDKDGNMIPDRVEEVAEQVTEVAKNTVKNVKKTATRRKATPKPKSTSQLPDLSSMTKDQLVSFAKENNIKVSSRARKVDILDTILSTLTPNNNK